MINNTLCSNNHFVYKQEHQFLENLKQRFKRILNKSWNKYRSKITTKPKNNNLDYMIDLSFRNINKLFLLPFKNDDNDPTRNYIFFLLSFTCHCAVGNEIIFITEVLKSKLCSHCGAYILGRGNINIIGHKNVTQVAFKNCAPLSKCITKIEGTMIELLKIYIWLCHCILY